MIFGRHCSRITDPGFGSLVWRVQWNKVLLFRLPEIDQVSMLFEHWLRIQATGYDLALSVASLVRHLSMQTGSIVPLER